MAGVVVASFRRARAIPFEDDRVAFADWGGVAKDALTVYPLEVDGQTVAQSNAIIARGNSQISIRPSWRAALCDGYGARRDVVDRTSAFLRGGKKRARHCRRSIPLYLIRCNQD
jgi:hypothetical protein